MTREQIKAALSEVPFDKTDSDVVFDAFANAFMCASIPSHIVNSVYEGFKRGWYARAAYDGYS
jgi:hypothetical protein